MIDAARHRVLYLTAAETVELRHERIPRPGSGELLLRVDAATTCGTDLKVFLRGGHPRMLRVPCPFGHEMTGTIAAVGDGVGGWREGDELVVANSASCGRCSPCRVGRENLCEDLRYLNGAYAEYLLVPDRFVARSTYRRPTGVEPALAAMAEPLACVLHGLSECELDGVSEAVVLGGGPIGLMFVAELARCGVRVTLGDPVARRLEAGRRLGASETVCVAQDNEDGERLRTATDAGRGADLVVEATGVPSGWTTGLQAVAPGGTVVLFGGCAPGTQVTCDSHRLHYSEITVKGVYHHRPATFTLALERLAASALDLGVLIDEEHPLERVELALRRMAARRILKAAIRPGDGGDVDRRSRL